MPAKKPRRRGRLIVIALVMLLVAGVGYGAYWSISTVRASFPQVSGELAIGGLTSEVTVVRDANGIPQLYADTPEDLFRAQGYVQAQDRFYEMDVRRHLTAGRLSEMFGSEQVETDAFLRTLGWHDIAQQEWDEQLSDETRSYLEAYTAGVNAYLEEREGAELSVEYAALGLVNDYEPEPWEPVDSVAWLKAMAWDLRGNMQEEIDRALLAQRLDPQEIEELYPPYPYERNAPIVTEEADDGTSGLGGTDGSTGIGVGDGSTGLGDGTGDATGIGSAYEDVSTQLGALTRTLDQIPSLLGPDGSGIGSNSWVVSGEYTTTGMPLLANDPHLAPSLPGVWYQMGLHCNEVSAECPFDVSGFTFSGMPGVVIGHNQNIAWGLTNLGADVTDLRLEKLENGNYEIDGRQEPYETRTEEIRVAGGETREITVRTVDGRPIISDRDEQLAGVGDSAPVDAAAPDRGEGYAVSLSWTALTPSRTMDAVFGLNAATNWDEFRAAAADFAVPSQNLIYADTEGNIGYQAPGAIPIRGEGDGRYPAPGWDSSYDWVDTIPFEELPSEFNPDRGYIVTANQAVVDEDTYPYMLTDDWSYGTRSQRIADLIEETIADGGVISMTDMQSIQLDNSNEMARNLVPYLLDVEISDPYVREAQDLLVDWDYNQDADSPAAAYYNAVWSNLLQLAFGNKLPKELRVEGQCLLVRPADESQPIEDLDGSTRLINECGERSPETAQPDGGDRWFEVVGGLLEDPENEWWSTPATRTQEAAENRDELLARAMRDARWELTAELGKDIDTWSWGRLHRLMLNNQTLGTEGPGPVQWLLNRGPWNIAGGSDAVDASGWNAAGGYDITWVPSMRMIVSLDDFDESQWINLSGASGHAFHANYTDQTELWADGEYLPWPHSAEAVAERGQDTLTLTPTNAGG